MPRKKIAIQNNKQETSFQMKSLYIYPTYTPEKDKTGNKYIKYFHDSFSKEYTIKNRHGKLGIAGLFFNLSADCFILHWVDLIITKQKGRFQVFLFLLAIRLLRFLGKKIVWVLHNKKPHRVESKIALYCMKVAGKNSHVIVCHAREGRLFLTETYGAEVGNKMIYIPHPVYSTELVNSLPEKWDVVIWGTIERYKNLVSFLKFAKESLKFREMRILICGFCPDKEYEKEILNELRPNISYLNRFLTDLELKKILQSTKSILFTYKLESVLSSGALVYSLNFCKKIIGPKGGAFEDLEPIVTCYETFADLENINFNESVNKDYILNYLRRNTWTKLPAKIIEYI